MKLQTTLFIILIIAALVVTVIHFLPESTWKKLLEPSTVTPVAMDTLPPPVETEIPTQKPEPPPQPPKQLETINHELLQRNRDLSDFRIEVSKNDYRLQLYKHDKLVRGYSVALGNEREDKLANEDPITPLGHFYIVSIENTSQRHPEDGPWFIRLHTGHFDTLSGKAFSGIGIKGGASAQALGKSMHTDCIIMQNKDITDLKGHIQNDYKQVRLPVTVRP